MGSFIKDSPSWKASPDICKQMGAAVAHGVGDFALNTGTAISTLGWGLTTPLRAPSWLSGKSSFSQDWNSFQQSNDAFRTAGNRWMQNILPADIHSEEYRTVRSSISSTMELGMLAAGGYGIAKGATTLASRGISSVRNAFKLPSQGGFQVGFQLNRFQKGVPMMDPHTIRFSQSSIGNRFRGGSHIDDLAQSLRIGAIQPQEVQPNSFSKT